MSFICMLHCFDFPTAKGATKPFAQGRHTICYRLTFVSLCKIVPKHSCNEVSSALKSRTDQKGTSDAIISISSAPVKPDSIEKESEVLTSSPMLGYKSKILVDPR